MIDAEKLLAEINRVTGQRLHASDPVMAAAVINDVLLARTLAKLDKSQQLAADRITVATVQATEDANARATLLITKSAEWVTERLRIAADEAVETMLVRLRDEAGRARVTSRVAVRAAWLAGFAALLSFAGVAGFLIAAIKGVRP